MCHGTTFLYLKVWKYTSNGYLSWLNVIIICSCDPQSISRLLCNPFPIKLWAKVRSPSLAWQRPHIAIYHSITNTMRGPAAASLLLPCDWATNLNLIALSPQLEPVAGLGSVSCRCYQVSDNRPPVAVTDTGQPPQPLDRYGWEWENNNPIYNFRRCLMSVQNEPDWAVSALLPPPARHLSRIKKVLW